MVKRVTSLKRRACSAVPQSRGRYTGMIFLCLLADISRLSP